MGVFKAKSLLHLFIENHLINYIFVKMENKRIFLIGFMGVGKSTLGKKLANKLNWEFIDIDQAIEQKFDMSVLSFFKLYGESIFREEETRMVKKIVEENRRAIIATGGGLPVFNNNMALLNRSGITCYLHRPVKELYQRLSKSREKRPLIKDLDEDRLLEFIEKGVLKRETYYNLSQHKLNRDQQTVEQIINILELNVEKEEI